MFTQNLIKVCGKKQFTTESILFLKANTNYTEIYLNDGSLFMSANTLGIYEDRLKSHSFFRPNRSIIVNLDYLTRFEDCGFNGSPSLIMHNEMNIPISRKRLPEFLKILNIK